MRGWNVTFRCQLSSIAIGLLLTFAAGLAMADGNSLPSPVEVTVQARPMEITMGDRVHYQLDIVYPEGLSIQERKPLHELGDFEILDATAPTETHDKQGRKVLSKAYSITAFATGTLSIPPYEVFYSDAQGVGGSVKSAPLTIAVKSLIGSGTPTLRDIKPPATIPMQVSSWVWWILGALIALVVLVLLLGFWKKPQSVAEVLPPEFQIPADTWALQQLRKIRLGPILKEKQTKALALAVSEIVRRYLDRRFQMNTIDMTTEEILDILKETPILRELDSLFGDFLSLCDLIKFAKYQPPDEKLVSLLDQAETIVKETAPAHTTQQQPSETQEEGLS